MSNNTNAALATIIANAVVAALSSVDLGNLSTEAVEPKAKARKASKAKATPAVTGGPTFKEAQAMLVGLKAKGEAPAGMTTRQAIEAGLIPALGTTAKAPKGKKAKAGKAKAKPEGTPFSELRARLVVLKSQGLIPAGMSVRVAQAEGLVDDEVRFLGTAPKAAKASKGKKAKARKAEKVAAVVEADEAAKVRASDGPRRADGTITPASQWAEREALALTGQFDRFQIDAIVEPERAHV